MNLLFYIASAVALASTVMVVTRRNAVHALLYLVVSLFSVALIFFLLGAPFVAALEIIIYAGAIIVLFLFVVMLLNLGPEGVAQERRWLRPGMFVGPVLLSLVLAAELIAVVTGAGAALPAGTRTVGPKEVGTTLLGPYFLGVEIASMLLLAGLVGAYHLGRRDRDPGGDTR